MGAAVGMQKRENIPRMQHERTRSAKCRCRCAYCRRRYIYSVSSICILKPIGTRTTSPTANRSWLASSTSLPESSCPPVGHTPRVLMQGRKKTDSYYNSLVILLGLVPCNPTMTPAL
jgi:hypothetical protein